MDIITEHSDESKCSNNFNQTPLHFAVKFGEFDTILTHLERGAQINVMDIFGNTPLSIACIENPDVNIVRLLIEHGADVNFERLEHLDLLQECVANCNTKVQLDIIEVLVKEGVHINATDRISNRNCMHYVAKTGYLPLAKFLLKNGAIVNIRDNFNLTPMQLAEIYGNQEVLALFNSNL